MSQSNKPFDFGGDLDHDLDPGIFNGISTAIIMANCENVAVLAVLAALRSTN